MQEQSPAFFAEMALDLRAEPDTASTLEKIAEYALAATGCDDAGILIVHARTRVETATATSTLVTEAHNLQLRFDEGPCLDAIDGPPSYLVQDTASDDRWPLWGPAVTKIGIRSALGVRLATRNRRYGSLNLYSRSPHGFAEDDDSIAQIFASHASVALSAAHEKEGLTRAVDGRQHIGLAQGILMERFGIDPDRAFNLLQRYSQSKNIKLRDIASMVVTSGELPPAD